MKKHSCGAILFTIYKNQIYIILGMEKGQWFPFKGTNNNGESNIQTAIREIYEETYGVVKLQHIDLKCNFSTKRKHYHIGLVQIPYHQIEKFYRNRSLLLKYKNFSNKYSMFLEKTEIKLFPLHNVFNNNFHEVTKIPIKYFYNHLSCIEFKLKKLNYL